MDKGRNSSGIRVDGEWRDSAMASIHGAMTEDWKRVLDEGGHFTVLAEWGSRKFFYVQGRSWAFTGSLTVPPRTQKHPTVICFK